MTGPIPAELLVEVTRHDRAGDREIVESVHHGHLVVVDADGIVASLGDPDLRTYLRSTVKPFQATAMLETLGEAADDLTDEQLAVAWASHVAADVHLAAVTGLLDRAGVPVAALTCPPMARAGRVEERRIHSDCSGKHALFAWAGTHLGLPRERWLDRDGEVQQRALTAIVDAVGAIDGIGVDGCGAPAVHGSLAGLAQGYLSLRTDPRWARVASAGLAAPELVGGEDRPETALLAAGVHAKPGAEGLFVAAFDTDDGPMAVACKIMDGADRAAATAVVAAVAELGGPAVDWTSPVLGGGEPQGVCRAVASVTSGRD